MKTLKSITSVLILALAIAGAAQADDLKADSVRQAAEQSNPPSWGLDRVDQ